MKTNGKEEVLGKMNRRGLLLAALLVLVLSYAAPGSAQSTVATTPTQQTKPAVTPVLPMQTPPAIAKPGASQVKAAAQTEEKLYAKGQREGITVHGHWTIDVKNPDGSLVSHRDFENSLTSGGKSLLTSLLLGSTVPGSWRIFLEAGTGSFGPGGPCTYTDTSNNVLTYCEAIGSIVNPSPALCGGASNCFQTLTITPTPSTGLATGFTLSATAISSQAGSIANVVTGPAGCGFEVDNGSFQPQFTAPSTCAALPQAPNLFDFTSTSVSPAVQILTAGQTIAVTVQISFQ